VRKLRKAIYTIDESPQTKLLAKNTADTLEAEIDYCQKLIETTLARVRRCVVLGFIRVADTGGGNGDIRSELKSNTKAI
jgi:hypothetical protein